MKWDNKDLWIGEIIYFLNESIGCSDLFIKWARQQ